MPEDHVSIIWVCPVCNKLTKNPPGTQPYCFHTPPGGLDREIWAIPEEGQNDAAARGLGLAPESMSLWASKYIRSLEFLGFRVGGEPNPKKFQEAADRLYRLKVR